MMYCYKCGKYFDTTSHVCNSTDGTNYKNDIIINRLCPKNCVRDVLTMYSEWLHDHGYIDTDWYAEEPNAVDRFLQEASND